MAIRVANLRLALDEPESALPQRLAEVLGVRTGDIRRWRILRKALDTRRKDQLRFVYTAEVAVDSRDEARLLRNKPARGVRVDRYEEPPFRLPEPGQKELNHRPVIVGSGPAGLAVAYFLAQAGYAPLVLERGPPVRDRIRDVARFESGGPLDPESNYLFGEGGAGTFSDGKLTCRRTGPDVRRILRMFAEHKGKPSVVYDYRPHLGSNRLPAVVKSLRRYILAHGGEVRFRCRVEDLDIRDGCVHGVMTSSGYIATQIVVLAIGHSARDTYAMLLRRGLPIVPKPFQMGLRVEHPQELVNRVQYGESRLETRLGAADYALIARGRYPLFTFCMCAGGQVIPSVSEPGFFCTNGMSLSRRDTPFANSGLVVTVPVEKFGGEDVLAGVRLQQRFESVAYRIGRGDYLCPVQTAADFLDGKTTQIAPETSYRRGVVPTDLHAVVPDFIAEALHQGLPIMDGKWQGRFIPSAVLLGPETRGSSPVRIVRDPKTRQTPEIAGIYPVGEGAGYAGGIVSAAVDGLQTAKAVIADYAPLQR